MYVYYVRITSSIYFTSRYNIRLVRLLGGKFICIILARVVEYAYYDS